jgi:lysophospholipase L1-like esterase
MRPRGYPRRVRRTLVSLLLACGLLAMAAPAHAELPAGIPAGSPAKAKPRALFFGDSYFVGGGCSPDATQDMAYLAGTALGYRPTVRGAGGTGFVAANPDYGLPPYLAQIHDGALDLKNPALVVIEGGSNDLGFPSAQIKKNAGKVLHIARTTYPRALLILVGPMDPYGSYDDTIPVRDALKTVAHQRHVPFVDDLTWLQDRPGQLCDDYDHPTYAAGVTLGQRLEEALHKLGA